MLSICDYEADKGKVFALADAQKFKVAGHSAVLLLSENENDSAFGLSVGRQEPSITRFTLKMQRSKRVIRSGIPTVSEHLPRK